MKGWSVSTCLAALLLISLGMAGADAQEKEAAPLPVTPAPARTNDSQSGTQRAAPVVRRTPKPTDGAIEDIQGPLTEMRGEAQAGAQTANGRAGVSTLKVQSRLVNVTLNVVNAQGAPVGGFQKQDFRIFENDKPQRIALFERETTSPLSIVLAIDTSETVLTSDRLEKQAARHFVEDVLRPQDEIDLMTFADTVHEVVPFTNQPKLVEQRLSGLERGQETSLYNAVYLASERLAETSAAANRRRILVVISDGGNSIEGGERYEQAIAEAQRADAMIFSIIIVPIEADAGRNTGGEHALIQMAEDTGGKYYYVVNPADLEPAFRHVSDDLRTQYLLGYYAPEGDDTGFRRIKVTLTPEQKRDGLSLRYRTGYFPELP